MILIRSADGEDHGLLAELTRATPPRPGRVAAPGLIVVDDLEPDSPWPPIARARQVAPNAEAGSAPSINAWARLLYDRVRLGIGDGQPWRLHVQAHYGGEVAPRMGARAWHSVRLRSGAPRRADQAGQANHGGERTAPHAGARRCQLIEAALLALLKRKDRRRLRALSREEHPFAPDESLVQLWLTAPDMGWVSLASPPLPARWAHGISPFPGGEVTVETDREAPSRAYTKLLEAQRRLGRTVQPGETCVDLGASPGGWSHVALKQGAHVTAVDRSPLRDDLMAHPRLRFIRTDAFTWRPDTPPVDWLICDVIAAPEHSIALVTDWLRAGAARWFIVTVKLRGAEDHPKIDRLKAALPALTQHWNLTHLCANKGEVCVFGRACDDNRD